MWGLYSLAVHLYGFLIRLASLFGNEKAQLWIRGRSNWKKQLLQINKEQKALVWFHCASLGEFEQGRPLIESFRREFPDHFLLLSFFSPSGYVIRKNYSMVDHVAYLPLDTAKNARIWIDTLLPELIIFVKYEFWLHFLSYSNDKNIPFLYIAARFRKQQFFFKKWGSFYKKNLQKARQFFVQDDASAQLLKDNGFTNVTFSGDTRFDRVISLASMPDAFPEVEHFAEGSRLCIAGSTWPEDEKHVFAMISESIQQGVKWIIAPHEVHADRLRSIEKYFGDQIIRYGQISKRKNEAVLLIDRIGLLAHLYQYAYLAYIGGGFGKGIHNTQEALVFGVPVIFGPNYTGFTEAVDLVKLKAAFTVSNASGLEKCYQTLMKDQMLHYRASKKSRDYIFSHAGGTKIIMDAIKSYKILSS